MCVYKKKNINAKKFAKYSTTVPPSGFSTFSDNFYVPGLQKAFMINDVSY